MAKNKKSKKGTDRAKPMSPERYIKEKGRAIELYKSYISPEWEENGIANVLVTRRKRNGELIGVMFLVDTFCLGVKDVSLIPPMDEDEMWDKLKKFNDHIGLEEIPYVEAHNIIYGAVAFAEDAEIPPCKDFEWASGILEEDTDDIPLIEYEFGKDGKYCLFLDSDDIEAKKWIPALEKCLGDKFTYIVDGETAFDDFSDNYESGNCEDMPAIQLRRHMLMADTLYQTSPELQQLIEELKDMRDPALTHRPNPYARHPREPYHYDAPDYNLNPQLHIPVLWNFIDPQGPGDALHNDKEIRTNELLEDLEALGTHVMAHYHTNGEKFCFNVTPQYTLDAVIGFFGQLPDPSLVDIMLEFMRQDFDFVNLYIPDGERFFKTLYKCATSFPAHDKTKKLVDFLHEPGRDVFARTLVMSALAAIAVNNPKRRQEIIGIFNDLAKWMKDNIPDLNGCDAKYAGELAWIVCDLKAGETLPYILDLYDSKIIDESVTGDREEFLEAFNDKGGNRMDSYRLNDAEKATMLNS